MSMFNELKNMIPSIINILNFQTAHIHLYILLNLFHCKIFKMFGHLCLAFVCQLVITVKSLHLMDTTQAQIDALKAQQTNFENTVNKLILNITNVEKSINSTTNVDQKVIILENAILSERQSVYELSKIIIPPFNISKDGCEKMTDQQKVQLLQQLDKARKEVYQLRNISATMPKCDDVDVIKRDIQKQLFFLNSIESIIYTNCSMNVILSPTIFQTNIYAPNWVLGNMTIDDLIQQYYQRSIRYDNITNCPIDFPFFDSRQCIQCPANQPAFDISQKKCMACPPDYHIDNAQKKCVPDKHYTNFTNLTNYSPINGPFPIPEQGATPCPADKPYFDGTLCAVCSLPQYWDIPSQSCKNCSAGQVFDMNIKACTDIKKNYLTVLSGTRWVTGPGNFTNVLKERSAILINNQTTGIYQQCPVSTPYYDGITCVPCSYQFDLNTLKCVTAPNGTQFDANIHEYIPPQTAETVPTAPNLLGTPPADDPNIPNCNSTNPYWDGVACIKCPDPFILFDLNTKRCVVCDPLSYYDNKTRSCVPRPIIYISPNENRLLATPNRTIPQYHDNVTATIQNNPQAVLVNCPDPTQYSDYKSCITCAANEYFNVETFKCEQCLHNYDPVTKLCKIVTTNFTNLNAPNIVNLTDPAKEQQYINEQLASNPDNRICDISVPYWNGTNCTVCTAPNILFDYSLKRCVPCPNGFALKNNSCVAIQYVSNVTAIPNGTYVETAPDSTLANITRTVNIYKANGTPYIECSADTPIYNATQNKCVPLCPFGLKWDIKSSRCVACPDGQYMAANGSCVPAPLVSNIPAISTYPYIETLPNATLANLSQLINAYNASGTPYIECPAATPIHSTTQNRCVQACPAGQQLDLASMKCVICESYVAANHSCPSPQPRYPNLTAAPWASTNTSRVVEWRDNLTRVPGAQICPPTQPHFNGYLCIACAAGQYYDYDTLQCKSCPAGQVFNPNNLTCSVILTAPYQTNPDSPSLIYGTKPYNQLKDQYNVNKTNGVLDCPPEYPYQYSYGCTNCLPGYYFHLDYKMCMHCPVGTTYKPQFRSCISDTTNQKIDISPDIAKMYANIF